MVRCRIEEHKTSTGILGWCKSHDLQQFWHMHAGKQADWHAEDDDEFIVHVAILKQVKSGSLQHEHLGSNMHEWKIESLAHANVHSSLAQEAPTASDAASLRLATKHITGSKFHVIFCVKK